MNNAKPRNSSAFSVLESVALEVESFSRDVRAALTRIDGPEKVAVIAAIVIFCGCFLPWFSPNNTHTQTGMDGFATPHFGISVTILLLVRRIAHERRLSLGAASSGHHEFRPLEDGRIALYLLSLGALSTATCIALLIHFGDIAAFSQGPVEVRYGFYTVLVAGISVSACGIAKFS